MTENKLGTICISRSDICYKGKQGCVAVLHVMGAQASEAGYLGNKLMEVSEDRPPGGGGSVS